MPSREEEKTPKGDYPTLRSERRGQIYLPYAEPRGGKTSEGGLIVNCFAEPQGGKYKAHKKPDPQHT